MVGTDVDIPVGEKGVDEFGEVMVRVSEDGV